MPRPTAPVGTNVTAIPRSAHVPRRSFSVTWDYRCPFARNAHEHVVAGLRPVPPGT